MNGRLCGNRNHDLRGCTEWQWKRIDHPLRYLSKLFESCGSSDLVSMDPWLCCNRQVFTTFQVCSLRRDSLSATMLQSGNSALTFGSTGLRSAVVSLGQVLLSLNFRPML